MYISTPPSPEVENFQIKINYPAGDWTPDLLNQRQTCCHLSQRSELGKKYRRSVIEVNTSESKERYLVQKKCLKIGKINNSNKRKYLKINFEVIFMQVDYKIMYATRRQYLYLLASIFPASPMARQGNISLLRYSAIFSPCYINNYFITVISI